MRKNRFQKSMKSSYKLVITTIFKCLAVIITLFSPYSLFAGQPSTHNQAFYIPKDGDYSIKAYLKPNRTFIFDEVVNTAINTTVVVSMDAISGWEINPKPTADAGKPAVIIDKDGLRVDVKEGVTLTKEFSNIKLKENPYIFLSYAVQSPNDRDVIIYVWFKGNDGKILPTSLMLNPKDEKYFTNLYKKAMKIFSEEQVDELYIAKVSIVCRKKKRRDASATSVNDDRLFVIKNVVFLKHRPILANFENPLSDFQQGKYYYYDGHWVDRRSFDEIPDSFENIYSIEKQEFVNLKDNPVLIFYLLKSDLQQEGSKRTGLPAELRVLLSMDFDGDDKKDAQVETIVPLISNDSKLFVNIPAYEKVKKMFPNKKQYNMLGLSICYGDNNAGFYQNIISKRFFKYKEYIYRVSGLEIKPDMIIVDNKVYKLSTDYKKHERDNHLLVEFNKIKIGEGQHTIKLKDDERFRVAVVEIKAENSGQLIEVGKIQPKVDFKKINPTRYIVYVKETNEPFTLVFSESFNEGWKAYIRKAEGRSQESRENKTAMEPWSALWSAWSGRGNRTEIKDHFIVNGYANAWIVPIEKGSGIKIKWQGANKGQDFQIVLEYKPQRIFEAGVIISATALFVCIGCLGYGAIRWRRMEKTNVEN